MKIYIIRHGQDDDTVRGGWSTSPLTYSGIKQSLELANELFCSCEKYNIGKIYSSDIIRAKQTAEIISDKLCLPVELLPEFREVNNGKLAGLENSLADKIYPNLFWKNLEWEEHYPDGESPKEFYKRIGQAWSDLKDRLVNYDKNVLIVTHGGVINIIKCIVDGVEYSNKQSFKGIPCGRIAFEVEV